MSEEDFHDWLPDLVTLAESDNNWKQFVGEVYARFRTDFVESKPIFKGAAVNCRRDPIYDGKEAGFWHCISEGRDEASRTPDLRRCERIGWIRAIIENSHDPHVDVWTIEKRGDERTYFWWQEEFLIVLGHRRSYCQLITAFQTDREHTRRKLRRERDEANSGSENS